MRGRILISSRSSTALGLIVAAAGVFGLGATGAHAQEAASNPPQAADEDRIEEIVVTANKRSENLQDVPIAITAVTGARLESIGITDTQDLASVVPGLTIQNGIGGTQAHLRGVGTTAVGPGIENSVATYVDNVYMFSMSGALVQLNSIEQVEVLKGPQGTLFGRNATGGVINIRTRDPKQEPSGQFSLGYANYNTFSGQGYLTGGLGEGVAADIAGFVSLQKDGWGKNLFTGKDVDDLDQFAVRSKWLIEPGDRDTIRVIGDYSEMEGSQFTNNHLVRGKSANYGPGNTTAIERALRPTADAPVFLAAINTFIATGGQAGLAPFAVVGEPFTFTGDFHDTSAFMDPYIQFKNGGASLQWDHDFGSVRFTSVTAYREATQDVSWSADPVPAFRSQVAYHRREKQFSQELQLGSTAGSSIQWVAGLYYLNATAGFEPITIGGTPVAPRESVQFRTKVTAESGAAFGQVTVPLWSGAHLTGGLRYTVEKRGNSGSIIANFPDVLPPFLPPEVLALAGLSLTIPVAPVDKTFRKLTWRASIDQQLTPDILAYASYNRGFKSGTFNAIPPGAAPVDPEVLDAWEIGLKTDLMDRRVRFNIAGFYYKYKNIQVTVFTPISALLDNGASAEVYGLDLDLTAKVGSHLTLFGGLGLLDHKFTSYPLAGFFTPLPASQGGGANKVVASAKGNKLPYASDVTFNVGATYTTPIGNGEADLNVNYSHQSRWFAGPDNILSQPAYGLLDATATYRFPGDNVSVGVWARNITNEDYYTFLGTSENPGGRDTGSVGSPRTYGVKLGYKF